jgi:hypothetical protein
VLFSENQSENGVWHFTIILDAWYQCQQNKKTKHKYSMKHMKQSLNALKLIQCSNKAKQY